jgi:hypothetical protein
MKLWACLYPELDKEALEEGVNVMLKVVIDILASKKTKLSGKGNDVQENQDGGLISNSSEKGDSR